MPVAATAAAAVAVFLMKSRRVSPLAGDLLTLWSIIIKPFSRLFRYDLLVKAESSSLAVRVNGELWARGSPPASHCCPASLARLSGGASQDRGGRAPQNRKLSATEWRQRVVTRSCCTPRPVSEIEIFDKRKMRPGTPPSSGFRVVAFLEITFWRAQATRLCRLRPAGRNGSDGASHEICPFQKTRLGRSGRRVADRGGRVARAT